MKQLKSILNKKLFFLFIVLGSTMSVQAQLTDSSAQTLCQGTGIKNYEIDYSSPGAAASYVWSVTGTVSAILSSANGNAITINWSSVPVGTFGVQVIETNGTCSVTKSLVVNIIVAPSTGPSAVDQTFCSSASVANLVATGVTGATIKWYDALTGGTALASTDALVTGTTYFASQTVGTCESTRTSVVITITSPPIAPTAVAQTFCTASTVANLVATGTNIQWYAALTGGTALAGTDTLVTGTTYYASQTVGTCESTRTSAVATIAPAAAPTAAAQTFCTASTVANLVATGTNIQWYVALTGGTALAGTDALISGTSYYASQTIGTCESTRTAVGVTIAPAAAPTATATQIFCDSATVANLVTTSGTNIQWYAASTGGTALASTDVLISGTSYYASQTVGTCVSTRTAVIVTVTPNVAPTAAAQTFCDSATVANLVTTAGTNIQWYVALTGGTALVSTDSLVTGTMYYASQTVGTCESTRTGALVTITIVVTSDIFHD